MCGGRDGYGGRAQDQPFNANDLTIKAYVLEILSTMKSIVKLEHFFKEQLQTILTQAREGLGYLIASC